MRKTFKEKQGVIDNPYIGFISGTTSLWCLAVFCIVALLTAVVLVWVDRHNDP